jgi:hypothetical protein
MAVSSRGQKFSGSITLVTRKTGIEGEQKSTRSLFLELYGFKSTFAVELRVRSGCFCVETLQKFFDIHACEILVVVLLEIIVT